MAWTLVFWRNRSTATVVPAASASQARSRAQHKQKKGYGAIVAARRGGGAMDPAPSWALLCKANRLTIDPWPP